MNWQETSPNVWVLNLGNGTVTLAVFKSRYDPQCWHFSINDKNNTEPFKSLQAAKDAGLKLAIAQIDHTLEHLAEAKQEAEALLQAQTRTRESVELER